MKTEDIASLTLDKEFQMETTKKVKSEKIVKLVKPKAKKIGRPSKVQGFTQAEVSQLSAKIKPMQAAMKQKLGFEPSLTQTVDYCVYVATQRLNHD